jgi:hypothetical protein
MAMIYGSEPNTLQRRLDDLQKNKLTTREDILNLFTPNSPITSPIKFAGRAKPLEEVTDALMTKGADIILFGERGGGKSSLANMLHGIATGHLELLDYYDLRERLERKYHGWLRSITDRKQFNVIWVNGGGRTINEVINLVLTRRREKEFGPGLLYYLPTEADQTEISAKIGFDRIFTTETELKQIQIATKPLNIKEGFELALQRYADRNKEELLIILDEFETVADRQEISQYMKSMKGARFVLVGIGDVTFDLLREHSSIARDTHGIKLGPMTEDELRQILSIGSTILAPNYGFHPLAVEEIVKYSFGSPYWCHFLARALVTKELDLAGTPEFFLTPAQPKQFSKEEVSGLIESLPDRADCRLFEEALTLLTMHDELTAKILLCIAKHSEGVISSAQICQSLETQGISKEDVMATIEGFLKLSSAPFVERSRIRDIVSFSFADPNLKKYILIRNAGLSPVVLGAN